MTRLVHTIQRTETLQGLGLPIVHQPASRNKSIGHIGHFRLQRREGIMPIRVKGHKLHSAVTDQYQRAIL